MCIRDRNAVSRKIISRVLADKCNNGRILSIFVFSLSLLGNCDQIRIPYYADILSNNVASGRKEAQDLVSAKKFYTSSTTKKDPPLMQGKKDSVNLSSYKFV